MAQSVDVYGLEASELLGSLHPGLSRALLYIVAALVAATLAWSALGEVDVVATTTFRLVPLDQATTVQAPRGGEIERIDVREGDRVEAGQTLFRLRSQETWSELRELEQAKTQLEKAFYDLRDAVPRRRVLLQETIASLRARREVVAQTQAVHHEALSDYRKTVQQGRDPDTVEAPGDVRTEMGFRSAELGFLKRKYAENQALFAKGLISRSALEEARIRYLNGLAELPERMDGIHKLEATARDLDRQILEAELELARDSVRAVQATEDARTRFDRARRSVDRALEEESDLIQAREAGVVTQVLVGAVGEVVARGQAMAVIAPESAPMVAEVAILNRDVGFVRPGQVVRLKYDAFPFAVYGIKRGYVLSIPPDATVDPALGAIYPSMAELEDRVVRVRGEDKPLIYGMKGTAEIVTDRQPVLRLFLRPLHELYRSAAYSGEDGEPR